MCGKTGPETSWEMQYDVKSHSVLRNGLYLVQDILCLSLNVKLKLLTFSSLVFPLLLVSGCRLGKNITGISVLWECRAVVSALWICCRHAVIGVVCATLPIISSCVTIGIVTSVNNYPASTADAVIFDSKCVSQCFYQLLGSVTQSDDVIHYDRCYCNEVCQSVCM